LVKNILINDEIFGLGIMYQTNGSAMIGHRYLLVTVFLLIGALHMIGGHNKPCPGGLEYYLPYQTSIVKSAGLGETMIYTTRKTVARNDMDLTKHWRNRNRKRRAESRWYEWIKKGVWLIEKDIGESTLIKAEQKQLTQ